MAKGSVTWICFNVSIPGEKGAFLVSFSLASRGWSVSTWELGKSGKAEFFFSSRFNPVSKDAVHFANQFLKLKTHTTNL